MCPYILNKVRHRCTYFSLFRSQFATATAAKYPVPGLVAEPL